MPRRKLWFPQTLPRPSAGFLILAILAIIILLAIVHKSDRADNRVAEFESQSIRIIDGDTIELDGKTIRLFGIDAPELGQPCTKNSVEYDCGNASKEYLEFLVAGTTVTCDYKGDGGWGRQAGVCRVDGKDVSRSMVRSGWAIAYTEYSLAYKEDEIFARKNELGMWVKNFSEPSDWRKQKRRERE